MRRKIISVVAAMAVLMSIGSFAFASPAPASASNQCSQQTYLYYQNGWNFINGVSGITAWQFHSVSCCPNIVGNEYTRIYKQVNGAYTAFNDSRSSPYTNVAINGFPNGEPLFANQSYWVYCGQA